MPRLPASRMGRKFTTSSRSCSRGVWRPHGPTGRVRLFHVHHKAERFIRQLYAAIGEPDNRNRKPVGLGRAVERLMILDGALADTSLVWVGTERDKHRHFVNRLGNRVEPHEYPRLVFGKGAECDDALLSGQAADRRRAVRAPACLPLPGHRPASALIYRILLVQHQPAVLERVNPHTTETPARHRGHGHGGLS